ncbi:hypothetical protein ACFWN5_36865 [Streptomyces sp. NPDC058430]|uniref:hypothetical protein n=1 Tax=Streptomyces sp. NPDC058430 TaxID=3346495 RepID=UPI003661D6D9
MRAATSAFYEPRSESDFVGQQPGGGDRMRIELHIGRLILEGVPPHDAAALRAALESELDKLLSREPVTSRQDHHQHHATTPTISTAADPAALGRHIARAVHSSLRRGTQRKAGRAS